MAYFKINRFKGIAPAVSPRLLAEGIGQTAENVDLESGRLVPIQNDDSDFDATTSVPNEVALPNANKKSIFVYNDTTWLTNFGDNLNIDLLDSPVINDAYDRIYFTGDTFPKYSFNTSITSGSGAKPDVVYRLGIPAPDSALSVSVSGSADAGALTNDVSYVYTFVLGTGEEGPPSPASTVTQLANGQTANLSAIDDTLPTHPGGGSINYYTTGLKRRIYRSNTGSTNTEFQFVKDISSGTTTTDTADADALGEILPSTTWIGPPDDNSSDYPDGQMLGLTFIANGVFAGFSGRMLCFSEPFLPHAWPADYRLTLDRNIVGLGVTTNGIAVMTEGSPYFVGGTDPGSMTAIKLDSAQACLNKNSIVDMGDYVLYAGPDGLVAISGNEVQIVSKGVISPEQWKDAAGTFRPAAISAFRYKETYVAFDLSSSTGWVYDPKGQENMFTTLSSASAVRGGYEDLTNGDLYLIVGSAIHKYREGDTTQTLTYKSGKFVTPAPMSMSYVSVDADSFATNPVVVKVFGDGTLISNYSLVLYKETIAESAVNESTDVITIAAHGFETGASVTYNAEGGGTALTLSTGAVSDGDELFVIVVSSSTIKLASTRDNAFANTAVTITNDGNDSQTLTSGNLLQQTTTVPSGISTKAYLQEPIMRLPATIAQEWEVQIETKQTINDVCIAQSIDEIKAT
tara:strand:+ start:1791 stop:3848 length:2058 start_codon:yes stop_codon:yes gene_type:complete